MAKTCNNITGICCIDCIKGAGFDNINISRINAGKLVVIFLGGEVPYYCAEDGSCILRLLENLSMEGVNVEEDCLICTMLDLPMGKNHLPIMVCV